VPISRIQEECNQLSFPNVTQFVLKVQFSDRKSTSSRLNHDFGGKKVKNAIALFSNFAKDAD